MIVYARRLIAAAALFAGLAASPLASAQGTRQWTTDRYDEFQRGTQDGIALRSDGRLEAGLAVAKLYTASESYIWALAQGPKGAVYAGLGGSAGGAAAVVRIAADGTAEKIFSGKEIGVQAVKAAPDGTVFAATSPGGRVYRLDRLGARPGTDKVVFDPEATSERPKYLWDMAVAADGTLYVATGAPAAVYRLAPDSTTPDLLFRTADLHIRSLLLTSAGVLWAGSDGAGVIYRLDTRHPGAKPFAAYAAAHREITSLATDGSGAIYAAAVGAKGPGSLPPLPVTGAVGVSITLLQPGSTSAAGSNSVVPDGSEIDRIAPDGTPQRLLSLKDDVIYALLVHKGQVLAATGNRGRVYRIDPAIAGRFSEVAHTEAGQATVLADGPAGLLAGTSNSGSVVRLQDEPPKPVYISEVFDAGQYARWGRAETQTDGRGAEFSVRTGNVPGAAQGWSDWIPLVASGDARGLPEGRYAQWRAALLPSGAVSSVTLNYLPRNVAPVVDDVVVATGARITSTVSPQQPATVQVVFPSGNAAAAQAINLVQQETSTSPLTAQKDRNGIVIRWAAHDDNNDDLTFAVSYRSPGETTWRLLKDKISDRFLSFDASLLPDGRYEAKVTASDAPVHTDAETLSGDRVSALFTVDTTPPVPGPLHAHLEQGAVLWTFEAHDATSPIAHAEFSIDAGPWQYVEPVGGLSDALSEQYEVRSPLPAKMPAEPATRAGSTEHTLAVRVYDRAENMSSVKTVVR